MLFIDFSVLNSLSISGSYNSRLVSKSILIVKKSKNAELVEGSKIILFRLLSSIVVKNIGNFFHLVKDYDVFHTKDDLVNEAFIILNNCLESFDVKRNKEFYFYYNKSLTRAFFRFAEKYYFKHRHCVRGDDLNRDGIGVSENVNDGFVDFYLDILNLDEFERKIFESRMNKEKLKDFLERNKGATSAGYFKALSKLKVKLKIFKEEND